MSRSTSRHVLTILAVDDLERAAGFYEQAFGWPRSVSVPVYVELDAAGMRLGLYLREGFAKNTGGEIPAARPPRGTSATEIYLHCDDLDDVIARLRAIGARVLSELAPRPWGDDAAYFADPEGNVVAVARPRA